MRTTAIERREKEIDSKLRVHAWTPSGFITAGVLELEEDGESISASFAYDPGYLTDPRSFPLDPINMPLGKTLFASTSQFVRVGAIFDAAPDAWGRRVVQAQLPEEARQRVFRGAFLRGADGIGGLVLTPNAATGEIDLDEIVAQSLAERPGTSQLEKASRAALKFEEGAELTDEMKDMLGGSWTIGGARPKAILRDESPGALPGCSVIAKFQSRNDTIERNRLEIATLRMAADMGFTTPGHRLEELANGQTVLVLDRFDRHAVDGKMRRRHYVSAMSLASYEPQSKFLNSTMDKAILSWSKLLDITSRICTSPAASRVQMFGRLCLNAALQNTDDHLKNFGFLKSPGSPMHYEIAPVFDVSPQGAQRHYLNCLDRGQVYTLHEAMGSARGLGIAKGAAQDVEDSIMQVLQHRARYFEEAGLNAADAAKVEDWVMSGLGNHYTGKTWQPAKTAGLGSAGPQAGSGTSSPSM
ncbi:type II toxin-antitoxin system HipA family toxin [Hydrogenophaga sp. 2FB]|uniref:type II toxin-antitoxin system HipA family toxin n=1 Tax=Hydrogenophaga sp. 2FB TaxID=2502187 RepID=UPI0010F5EF66|nr:type II toxin-antitoxin system HipA family toxin [Hydrogenophaga sp. 2FB]